MRERFKKQEESMKNNARFYLPWPWSRPSLRLMFAARLGCGVVARNFRLHLSSALTAVAALSVD
jgi:hypothetical protein